MVSWTLQLAIETHAATVCSLSPIHWLASQFYAL